MPSRSFAVAGGLNVQYLESTAPFANNLASFTLSAWVFVEQLTTPGGSDYFPIIWKGLQSTQTEDLQGPSLSIFTSADSNLQLWCERTYTGNNATIFSLLTGELQLNAWFHIAFKVNADGSCQSFVNGVETPYDPTSSLQSSGTPSFDDSNNDWTIGVDVPGDPNSSGFVGLVSDARIYSRALSLAEIQTLAAFGDPSATGLVAEWKMCGNDPEQESSGNGLPLTNHGSTVSALQPFSFCVPIPTTDSTHSADIFVGAAASSDVVTRSVRFYELLRRIDV